MTATAILFGLAANTDNLAIGIAYGVQRRRIRLLHNLLIALVTTTVTGAALNASSQLHRVLLPALPDWIGGAMLILLALAGFLCSKQRPEEAAGAGLMDWREAGYLSGALSVNNIGLAIAGGFDGLHDAGALTAVFCFSVALLSAGLFIGGIASRQLANTLSNARIGNAILLVAGLAMLFGK